MVLVKPTIGKKPTERKKTILIAFFILNMEIALLIMGM